MQWYRAGYLPNVITNASIKKYWFLLYHSDGLTKASVSYIPDNWKFRGLSRASIIKSPYVLSVDQNSALAFFQIIETIQKSQDSRFSCTWLAYKCNRRPFRNFERYPIKCRYPVIIRKMDIFWKFKKLIHYKFGAGAGTNRILSLHRVQSSQGHWVCH